MTIFKLPECTPVNALPVGAAVALGNFDGVHRGHQRLFDSAKELKENGTCTCSAVWTFTTLAKPIFGAPCLTDMSTKLSLFSEYGLDYAVFEEFDNVRNMQPEEFVRSILTEGLSAGAVVCGFNFKFAKDGCADANELSRLLAQHSVPLHIVSAVYHNDLPISSSRVREEILKGDMEACADLLGHPYSVSFPVVHGQQLGRTIGIPTINQSFPEGHIIPAQGIYACTVFVDGDIYLGVSNIGVRPTVADSDVVNCETHIINYNGDLYEREIKVEFYCRLREEMKFDSVDALRRQIKIDISATLDYFSEKYGE